MRDARTFGGWLKRRRMGLGLTQKELARRVGYAAVTLRKMEADELRPSWQMARKLAEVLELTPEEQVQFVRFARDEAHWDDIARPVRATPPIHPAHPPQEPAPYPPQFTSFIGRENELDDLARLLVDPTCRLVTVIGPGGVGKTRLAIELAARLLTQEQSRIDRFAHSLFAHGIQFVALQAINSSERLISAIADALQLPPPGAAAAREHLLSCLHDRQLLLVLDNFEHLRNWTDLLLAILMRAPNVKLLVTSQEALNLEQEWRYPLKGLPLSGRSVNESLQPSAERLFVERALRVSPAFDAVAESEAVQRICLLVEGIPLALELAATWTRVMSCTAIADEIVDNLAFLTSALRNVPERHRSMQAVFDRTWELLSPQERQIFARLSVFRGGFQRHAAERVVQATVPIIAALADKSLLHWEPGDRYRLHELLRQYAAERLKQLGEEAAEAHVRHCTYYADFLDQRAEDVNGRRQRLALAEIAGEIENVRAAWHYALDHARIADVQRAAYTFYLFHDFRSRYREGADLFEQALQQLDTQSSQPPPATDPGPTLAELLVCLGWLSIRLGELQQARAVLERSQALLARLAVAPRPGPGTDPLVALGVLANVLGDYPQAARLGEEARRRHEVHADLGNLMYAYFVLTNAAFARGRYAEASDYGVRACALADQLHDRWFMAYLVADLGNIARMTGDYAEAVRQYQIGYAIREEFGDPEGVAVALVHLGQVSLLQADLERAQAQFRQSLAIYREVGDRGGEATALQGLGMTAIAAGAYRAAAEYLLAALRLADAIGWAVRTNSILAAVAELFVCRGEPQQAATLLVPILCDPASDRETSDRARALLSRCTAQLAPDQRAAATHGHRVIDLPAVFAMLAAASTGTELLPAQGANVALTPTTQIGEVLVEPLTARELAILHLVAAGQSNQAIATQLTIAPSTAKWHVSQILGKLGVHSRTQALVRAREFGLLA